MPEPRRIKRQKTEEEFGVADLPKLVIRFKDAQHLTTVASKDSTKYKETMRKILVDNLEEEGYTDDKGSQYIDIEGVDGFKAIKNERRVSETVETDKLIEWLEKQGLRAECTKTVEVFDQDAFMRLVWEGKVPEKILKKFTKVSESFAFKVI